MTILHLLEEVLGNFVQQKHEYLFNCPFCSSAKKKLSVNLANNKWQCWVCGAKGGHIIWLLKKLSLSTTQLSLAKELLTDVDFKSFKNTTSEAILQLPPEYCPLWKPQNTYFYNHSLLYLKNRGITVSDILRYRIGYCTSGKYANCVIIPSYDANNQLNYFVARSVVESTLKYKNPPVSKNVILFENMINYDEPIVLVEGVFDAITIKQNAIPLLGKHVPKKLEHAILQNKVKDVVVFLDNDARETAMNIERKLSQYDINVRLAMSSEKDANQMGFDTSWECIRNSHNTGFKDFIKQRLRK